MRSEVPTPVKSGGKEGISNCEKGTSPKSGNLAAGETELVKIASIEGSPDWHYIC
jgi:hypothetical protein